MGYFRDKDKVVVSMSANHFADPSAFVQSLIERLERTADDEGWDVDEELIVPLQESQFRLEA